MVSIFGVNLSYTTEAISTDSISGNMLPTILAAVQVLVDNVPTPLLFVSSGQINFLISSKEIPGAVKVQVVRQGIAGPAIEIALTDAAPALFALGGQAIAQVWTATTVSLVTDSAPARGGDTIVLYATGLGHTQPNPGPGEIPVNAAYIVNLASLQLLLNGTPIDAGLIKYAGLTPYCAGLYQINFVLPSGVAPNPEIRVAVAGQTSASGLQLASR